MSLVSARLDRFKSKSDRLWNFRCPYCGDSQKDKSKGRGYLYVVKDHISYKCHNCEMSVGFRKFLEHLDYSLAQSYRMEKFADSNPNVSVPNNLPITLEENKSIDVLASIDCVPLSELPKGHRAVQYALSRKLPSSFFTELYYTDDMSRFSSLNEGYKNRLIKEERLIIPFRDKHGNLSGVTGRSLGTSKMRYITVRLSDYPMIYGMNRIDFDAPKIYICEGAFDSMFVNNAMAVGGSDLGRAIGFIPNISKLVLIFDNEPRNAQIVKIMERYISYGKYEMVVWPRDWKYKDINEAIVDGVTNEELMQTIYTNSHRDLSLKLAIRDWKKV